MNKIIVTGGSGFIGSNLVKFLINKNYEVINIDKISYYSSSYNLKNLNKKKYTFIKLDINSRNELFKILQKYKPDCIFNLAAETHVDRSIDDPSNFIQSNILGTYNLLEAIRKYQKRIRKKIKLVHVSTDEVYGDLKNNDRSNENYSLRPSSPYSASKAGADHLVNSFVRTYKIQALISHCCNNYGPAQFPEKLIPKLIYNIINNKPLPIYGNGNNSREWIHVKDHCEALLKISKKGKIGESYNVGSGKNINNLNLAKMLLKIAKISNINIKKNVKIKFVKDRPGHDLRYALDSKKIKKELKWKANIDLNKGFLETFKWYVDNRLFFKNFAKKTFNKRLGLKL